jgi:hypothetical protein
MACCACFMFLVLLTLQVQSIGVNGRFLRWDFKKLSINSLIVTLCVVWFAFGLGE